MDDGGPSIGSDGKGGDQDMLFVAASSGSHFSAGRELRKGVGDAVSKPEQKRKRTDLSPDLLTVVDLDAVRRPMRTPVEDEGSAVGRAEMPAWPHPHSDGADYCLRLDVIKAAVELESAAGDVTRHK